MVTVIAHNIVSPLGLTSEENYAAVKSGKTALRHYDGTFGLPTPFVASLFGDFTFNKTPLSTRFETMVMESVRRAIAKTDIDVRSERVAFILSTTKGNVELLANEDTRDDEREYPGSAAESIANAVGFASMPIVVCNACISGLAAIILGQRLIDSGAYDYAVVAGGDCQSAFTISGFQSFKALSPVECCPFDKNRQGLNLGEAAATIVLARENLCCTADGRKGLWRVGCNAIRNDANHISGPSRTGEGSYRAMLRAVEGTSVDDLAFVNVHGTATMYNDEMESIALERAGLSAVPVNALKGYYGHTLGAAGIMECIISMQAVDDGNIVATRGYKEKGVSGNITVNAVNTPTHKQCFAKLMSGFGGCNAAAVFSKGVLPNTIVPAAATSITHRVVITPDEATLDGSRLGTEAKGKALLTELYRKRVGDYPKFYKMDCLTRLGFIAAELLVQAEGKERFVPCEERAVILFNRSSSVVTDKAHQATINDSTNFFPSPSVFVYTLPNIITGEIAIRNKYYGETSLYILPLRDEETMHTVLNASLLDTQTQSVVTGWIDCTADDSFIADLYILERIS